MSKQTFGKHLPLKLEKKMQTVGMQIQMARLRRNLTMEQVADRAMISRGTLASVEKGFPTVAMGIYLRVLLALQLDDDILLIAKDDAMGRALQDINMKTRSRASKKS